MARIPRRSPVITETAVQSTTMADTIVTGFHHESTTNVIGSSRPPFVPSSNKPGTTSLLHSSTWSRISGRPPRNSRPTLIRIVTTAVMDSSADQVTPPVKSTAWPRW